MGSLLKYDLRLGFLIVDCSLEISGFIEACIVSGTAGVSVYLEDDYVHLYNMSTGKLRCSFISEVCVLLALSAIVSYVVYISRSQLGEKDTSQTMQRKAFCLTCSERLFSRKTTRVDRFA